MVAFDPRVPQIRCCSFVWQSCLKSYFSIEWQAISCECRCVALLLREMRDFDRRLWIDAIAGETNGVEFPPDIF